MASRVPAPHQSPIDGIRVLVVEDDPDLRSLMFLGLLLQGMIGDAAADGLEGLKLAMQRRYDVLICDIRMPGLSGIELTRKLRERKLAPKVILVSAHLSPEMVQRATDAGACRVLLKPLGLRALAQVVYGVVNQS